MPITAYGWDSDVLLSSSPSLPTANESLTDSGDHLTYTTSVHKYWDDLQPIAIQYSPNGSSGWAIQPATDYTFQACGGVMVFKTARTVGTNNFIRILSGYYMTTTRLTESHEWTLNMQAKMTNTTRFQNPWEETTVVARGAVAKVMTYQPDDMFTRELSNRLVLILYTDKTVGTRWECYAYLNASVSKWSPIAITTQDVDFTLDTPPYYYAT